jgi:hypothetical protein
VKYFLLGLASVSFVGGMITFWLPFPIGLPLLLVSLSIFINYSKHARHLLFSLARGYPRIEEILKRLQKSENNRN